MKTIINHPNHIIYASFDRELNTIDENIIIHILKKIKHINHFEEFKKYKSEKIQLEFKVLNENRKYKRIEKSLKKLSSINIEYSKNIPKHKKIDRTITNFISGYRKTDNKREVIIEVPGFTIEFLTYLKGGYGKLDFKNFISLRSIYSKRIYKLIAQYIDKGGFKLREDKFRKALGIENKYLRTSDLIKKKNLCKKEIDHVCDIEYNFKIYKNEKNTFLSFKIVLIDNSPLQGENKFTKLKKNRDLYIYNILSVFFPPNDSTKAIDITKQVIENGSSVKFYNRMKRLKDELSSNTSTKTKRDVTNLLISTILPEYKVKKIESS
jgi:plasmid replication initiation protein